ncbi:MAG TPA: polysaccharide biosynthesis/export family protein [Bryobacteraceae bacterium]|jgi:polysaccharide export outer membrane protein
MRNIIRPGIKGRCAIAFIFLFVCLTACFGQAPPKEEPSAQANASPPNSVIAPSVNPPAADTPSPAPTPASPPAQTPVAAQALPAPAEVTPVAAQPDTKKGKAPKGAKVANNSGDVTAQGVQKEPYVIGADDILFVNVLHNVDISGQVVVRPDGFISVRFAGEIKAAGLTTQQLTEIVADKLHTYLNNPEVIIQVIRINSKKYYVAGQIHKPGAYILSAPKTILEAIIEAGGPADFAKTKGIYVLRRNTRLPFNYNDVTKGKHLEQNILIKDGDVIQVP